MTLRYIDPMQPARSFHERITYRPTFVALVVFAAVLGVAAVAQLLLGSLGPKSPPTWVYGGMALIAAGLASTFRRLETVIDGAGVCVSYGGLKRCVAWSDVERVERTEGRPLVWGIGARLGLYQGRLALTFKVPNAPLVAVVPRRGSARAMLFSTRRPDEAVSVARGYLAG